VSDVIWPEARQMDGVVSLPRANGELVFDAPWQGRVLAMAVGLVQQLDLSWDEFRVRLVNAITDSPDRPYYESWTAALEALVIDLDIAQRRELSERAIHIER
jgi:nitrile hydratase accessory protein